jgi:hypothetical protein
MLLIAGQTLNETTGLNYGCNLNGLSLVERSMCKCYSGPPGCPRHRNKESGPLKTQRHGACSKEKVG